MDDNYYQTDKVSGGDINIQEAPSQGTQFLNSFINNLTSTYTKSQEKKQKDEVEKMNFYATLRKSGYSKEEAIDRLGKVFSGGFLEKVLGKQQAFSAPASDTYELENKKTQADIDKAQSEITLNKSKAGYYDAGGPKRSVIDKMTPNQLQSRLKWLSESPDSEDPETKAEIDQITEKLRGMTMGTGRTTTKTKYTVGQIITNKQGTKKYRVTNISDPNNPDVEEVK